MQPTGISRGVMAEESEDAGFLAALGHASECVSGNFVRLRHQRAIMN